MLRLASRAARRREGTTVVESSTGAAREAAVQSKEGLVASVDYFSSGFKASVGRGGVA